jgi:hypothetical protein
VVRHDFMPIRLFQAGDLLIFSITWRTARPGSRAPGGSTLWVRRIWPWPRIYVVRTAWLFEQVTGHRLPDWQEGVSWPVWPRRAAEALTGAPGGPAATCPLHGKLDACYSGSKEESWIRRSS